MQARDMFPPGHLLHEVRDIEAVPILADVYPHGSYTDPLQVELLKDLVG